MTGDRFKTRHEMKYHCTHTQLALIERRVTPLMRRDAHAGADGAYRIRSLYFDDLYNSCYFENEDGVAPREKYRIRIYNGSTGRISLELKKKIRGKTQKLSCTLTEAQCRALMRGDAPPAPPSSPGLLQALCAQMLTRHMFPKVIVEYDRTPYVYAHGNVRVTFDRDIAASPDVLGFLEPILPQRCLVLTHGEHILEVKYDAYFPDHIHRSIHTECMRQTTFSKYYICRQYGRMFGPAAG